MISLFLIWLFAASQHGTVVNCTIRNNRLLYTLSVQFIKYSRLTSNLVGALQANPDLHGVGFSLKKFVRLLKPWNPHHLLTSNTVTNFGSTQQSTFLCAPGDDPVNQGTSPLPLWFRLRFRHRITIKAIKLLTPKLQPRMYPCEQSLTQPPNQPFQRWHETGLNEQLLTLVYHSSFKSVSVYCLGRRLISKQTRRLCRG